MVKYEQRHQEDDEGENSQLVGSVDLRDSFKERGTLKGSFSLNGFEFRNFQAKDGPGVVDALNRSTNQSGVTASINEDGHLVLDNNDPADIVVQLGAPFEEPPAVAGSVADEVLNKLKAEDAARRELRDGPPENTILDDLGLPETDPANVPGNTSLAQSPDSPAYTGENAGSGGASGGTAGAGQTRNPTQIPSAPVADTGGEGQGKLADGRGRTGTGVGYHASPDGTPAVPGTPNNPQSGAADPALEGNPGVGGGSGSGNAGGQKSE